MRQKRKLQCTPADGNKRKEYSKAFNILHTATRFVRIALYIYITGQNCDARRRN